MGSLPHYELLQPALARPPSDQIVRCVCVWANLSQQYLLSAALSSTPHLAAQSPLTTVWIIQLFVWIVDPGFASTLTNITVIRPQRAPDGQCVS